MRKTRYDRGEGVKKKVQKSRYVFYEWLLSLFKQNIPRLKFQLLPEYVPQMERRRVERNNTFIFSLSVRCCCCTYILSVTFRRKQLNLMRKLNSNSLLRFGCAASLASDRKWSTSKLALNYGTSAVEYELAVPVPTLYAFKCCIQNEIWTFNTINWNWVLQKNSKCNRLRP